MPDNDIIVGQQRGITADGQDSALPIGGSAFLTLTPIIANSTVSTAWIAYTGYVNYMYCISSDVAGATNGIRIEYSDDGERVIRTGNVTGYANPGLLLRVAVTPISKYFRITYTNGTSNQGTLYFELVLTTSPIQGSTASVFQPINRGNLATLTKSIPELDDGTTVYAPVQRVGNSMKVNVTNQLDISGLAKSSDITSLQSGLSSTLSGLDVEVTNFPGSFEVSNLPDIQEISGEVSISNLPSTQQVSGSVSVDNLPEVQEIEGEVSVSNFPTSFEISNNGSNPVAVDGTITVGNFPNSQTVSGTVSVSNFPSSVEVSNDSGNPLAVSGTVTANVSFPSTQAVSISSIPLASGAATGTKQDVGNASLSSIDSKLTSPLTVTGSVTATISGTPSVNATITNSSLPVTGAFYQTTQPVSVASAITIKADTAGNQANALKVDGSAVTQPVSIASFPALATGSNVIGSISNTSFASTQSGAWTVTANAGTNLNTSSLALESGGNLASIKAKTDNIPALGQALAAGSVPVVLTASQLTTLTPPAAITGYATSTLQTTGNTSLSSIDTKLSSQATAALQTSGNTILSSIDAGIPTALGQTTMSASMPVTFASDQTALPVTVSGGATSVNQATGNTTLSSLLTSIGSVSDVAVTDPTASASLISLMKGVLYEDAGQATTGTAGATSSIPANTSTTILPLNTNRKGGTIFSESGTVLIFLGSPASTTQYTQRIVTNGYYEVPYYYTGVVTAFATTLSTVRVTILT